jgi:adenine-specific DNA methylase
LIQEKQVLLSYNECAHRHTGSVVMTHPANSPTIEDLRVAIFQLSPQDLMILHEEIEEKLQTAGMMQLAESGFQEWNDEEEDIYSVEPQP